MKESKQVNVLFVATATALVHAALSVAFVPFFSTLLVSLSAPVHADAADTGMLLGVITPLVYGGIGFALGALMAFGYDMFAWALLPSRVARVEVVVQEEEEMVARAAVGDSA